MATLKDIALRAGINVTTASKALRNSSDVSRETVLRVKKIAEELGYRPRGASLADRAGNRQVLIVCQEPSTDAYARMLQAIDRSLRRKGYRYITVFSDFDLQYELDTIRHLAPQCGGIIYMPVFDTEETCEDIHKTLREVTDLHDVPVVIVNAHYPFEDFDVLVIDEAIGYRQAVEYLVERGHTRFAFIGDRYYSIRFGDICQALAVQGLEIPKNHRLVSENLRYYACGYEQMGQLIRADPRPTAVFAQYDDIAVGAISRIRDEGLLVPEDFAIVGFDGSGYCKYLSPPLATIDQHAEDMGSIATRILIQKIQDRTYRVVQSVSVKSSLVVRRSMEGGRQPSGPASPA